MIQFISGADTISIHAPQFGYTVNLHLALIIDRFGQNVSAWDNGVAYDHRTLEMEMLLPNAEMKLLADFFNDTDARYNQFTIRLPAGSGFYPGGPDKRDVGDFVVSLEEQSPSGMKLAPFQWFSNDLKLLIHSTPATLIPAQVSEGPMSIGLVHGLRYPEIEPTPEYAITRSRTIGGGRGAVNLGRSADEYTTSLSVLCGTAKAAALVDFMQSINGRGQNILATVPDNFFLFGNECGSSGSYTVRMMENVIPIEYYEYGQYKIGLNLWKKP